MFNHAKSLLARKSDRRGITMTEYAITGALIAAMLVLAFPPVTAAVSAKFIAMAGNVSKG